jgi:hypothetical protein
VRLFGTFCFFCSVVFCSSAVSAQWLHQEKENAFDESKNMNIAMTANNGGFAFGFICAGTTTKAFRLIVPETWDAKIGEVAKFGMMKIRVDKGKVHDLEMTAMEAGGKTMLEATGAEVVEIATEIADAKRRVAVGIFLMTQMVYNQNFRVRRSGSTIRKSLKACGFSGNATN